MTVKHDHSERGDTLVEVLIAMVLFVTAAVGVFVGLTTMVSSSTQLQVSSAFSTAIRNASQAVTAELDDVGQSLYAPCATAADYQPGGPDAVSFTDADLPVGYTAEITAVQYWNGASFGATCTTGSTQPQPEEITVTVTDTLTGRQEVSSLIVGPADSELTVPATTSGLSAAGPDNETTFTESWSAANTNGDAVTDYLIRYSTDEQNWTSVDTDSTATSYTLSVASEATYYVEVAAVNAIGQGAWSSPDEVQWVATDGTETPEYGYVCPVGDTLSGSECESSSSVEALVSYSCDGSDLLNDQTCTPQSTYAATATSSCPTGYTASGQGCVGTATELEATSSGFNAQIQCSSAGNCVALDDDTASHLNTEVNGTWSGDEEVGSTTSDVWSVVTCSAGGCTVVGNYLDGSTEEPVAISESGGTWGSQVDLVADGTTLDSGYFSGVSCTSYGNCVAVGAYGRSTSSSRTGFANIETNGTWSDSLTEMALNLADQGEGDPDFKAVGSIVGCSPTMCTVTGEWETATATDEPYIETETGGTWSNATVWDLSSSYLYGDLGAISCTSDGDCAAGGYAQGDSTSPNTSVPVAMSETDGTWSAPTVLVAAGGEVSSLSCTSAGNCLAGGYYLNLSEYAFVATETNGTWSAAVDVAPASAADSNVSAVSCSSAGNCVATGQYLTSTGSQTYNGFVTVETNGTWGAPVEVGQNLSEATQEDSGTQLTALACFASGCRIFGDYVSDGAGDVGEFTVAEQPATVTYSCNSDDTLIGETCTTTTYAADVSYACNAGDSLSGSTCSNTTTYAATDAEEYSYSCPDGGSLSGSECYSSSEYIYAATSTTTYSCPDGGSLDGTECTTDIGSESGTACADNGGTDEGGQCYVSEPATETTTYSCPDGGSLSGSDCYSYVDDSYAATATPIGMEETCNAGDTLTGTTCTHVVTYSATASYGCSRGGSLSGTNCVGSTGYPAIETYSCSSGSLVGTSCVTVVTSPATQEETGETTTQNYGFRG